MSMNKELTFEEQVNLTKDIVEEVEHIGDIFEKYHLINQCATSAMALIAALTLRPPRGTEIYFVQEFVNDFVEALKSTNDEMPIAKVMVVLNKEKL